MARSPAHTCMRRFAATLAAGVLPVVITAVAAVACTNDGAAPPQHLDTSVTVLIDDPDGEIAIPAPPPMRSTSAGGGVGGG